MKKSVYTLIAIPPVIVLASLFILPIGMILKSVAGTGCLGEVFSSPRTYRILLFTLEESFLSAAVSVVAAIPLAYFFSSYDFPGKRTILTLSQIAFTIPTILVVLGFVIWYGNNGYFNRMLSEIIGPSCRLKVLYSFKAIILAHVYLNFPIAFVLLTGSLSSMSDSEERAARLLGRGPLGTFLTITLPKLKGSLSSSFILIFLYCFSSFTIVMVLGGSPSYTTLEAEIYRRVYISADMESAAAVSIFALFVTSLLLIITTPGRRNQRADKSVRSAKKAGGKILFLSFILMLMILLFLLPPALSIVYRSFFTGTGGFTLSAWKELFNGGTGPIGTAPRAIVSSLLIAFFSSMISVKMASDISISAAATNSKILPFISSLPLASGSVTLGLGFLLVVSVINIKSDALVYLFVVLSHVIITLPISVRTILPEAKKIPAVIPKASLSLGKTSSYTVRKVEKPMIRGAMMRAYAFSFALSLGEVNATVTLSSGSVTTLPVLIYKLINSYNYRGAAALGTILLAEALLVFAVGESNAFSGNKRNN